MKYIEEALPKLTEPQSSVGAMPKGFDTPQLKTNLTDAGRKRLFDELIKLGFMAANTDEASFLWAFGGSMPPTEFKPLKWVMRIDGGKYKGKPHRTALYYLFWLIVEQDTTYLTAEQERIINALFVDANGKNMNIPSKPSDIAKQSTIKNKLKNIIETVKK